MFFFSSRRRHTRWPRDWSSACALPIFYRSDMSVNLVGTPRFNQIHTHVTTVKNFSHHLTPIQIAAKNDTKKIQAKIPASQLRTFSVVSVVAAAEPRKTISAVAANRAPCHPRTSFTLTLHSLAPCFVHALLQLPLSSESRARLQGGL